MTQFPHNKSSWTLVLRIPSCFLSPLLFIFFLPNSSLRSMLFPMPWSHPAHLLPVFSLRFSLSSKDKPWHICGVLKTQHAHSSFEWPSSRFLNLPALSGRGGPGLAWPRTRVLAQKHSPKMKGVVSIGIFVQHSLSLKSRKRVHRSI